MFRFVLVVGAIYLALWVWFGWEPMDTPSIQAILTLLGFIAVFPSLHAASKFGWTDAALKAGCFYGMFALSWFLSGSTRWVGASVFVGVLVFLLLMRLIYGYFIYRYPASDMGVGMLRSDGSVAWVSRAGKTEFELDQEMRNT